jgi:hypothetical protein
MFGHAVLKNSERQIYQHDGVESCFSYTQEGGYFDSGRVADLFDLVLSLIYILSKP